MKVKDFNPFPEKHSFVITQKGVELYLKAIITKLEHIFYNRERCSPLNGARPTWGEFIKLDYVCNSTANAVRTFIINSSSILVTINQNDVKIPFLTGHRVLCVWRSGVLKNNFVCNS